MADKELGRIQVSPGRRVIGLCAMIGLGGLLLYLGLSTPVLQLLWRLLLTGLGAVALWAAQVLWRNTTRDLVLTENALVEDGGQVLARIDEIEKVDRSPFAMKPSNGFLLILKEPRPRAWRPGLWWRTGRRVAVGGVTAASQTKPVADILTLKLREREESARDSSEE